MKKRTREHIENLEQKLQYIHTIRTALVNALDPKQNVQIARVKHRKERLTDEQIRNLQRQVYELTHVLVGLTEKVKPYGATYAASALSSGHTARDEKALQAFFHRMSLFDKSMLTRERMNAEFDAMMPELMKGRMEYILQRHYLDGQHVDLYRIVFGNVEPPAPEAVNEDDEPPSST
jgi:hypothetical protein